MRKQDFCKYVGKQCEVRTINNRFSGMLVENGGNLHFLTNLELRGIYNWIVVDTPPKRCKTTYKTDIRTLPEYVEDIKIV